MLALTSAQYLIASVTGVPRGCVTYIMLDNVRGVTSLLQQKTGNTNKAVWTAAGSRIPKAAGYGALSILGTIACLSLKALLLSCLVIGAVSASSPSLFAHMTFTILERKTLQSPTLWVARELVPLQKNYLSASCFVPTATESPMRSSFPIAMQKLEAHEGGYSDHWADNGGKTKYGITQSTLDLWRETHPGHPYVSELERSESEQIFKEWYWDKVQADKLPAGLDYAVFDMAVNAGPYMAIKTLQKALGVPADGILGQRTLLATKTQPVEGMIAEFNKYRLHHMMTLSDWKHFKNGWTKRVLEVTQPATELANV